MLGLVFTEFIEMVESRFSPEVADAVLADAAASPVASCASAGLAAKPERSAMDSAANDERSCLRGIDFSRVCSRFLARRGAAGCHASGFWLSRACIPRRAAMSKRRAENRSFPLTHNRGRKARLPGTGFAMRFVLEKSGQPIRRHASSATMPPAPTSADRIRRSAPSKR